MENSHKLLYFRKNKAILNNITVKQEILFVFYGCLTTFDAFIPCGNIPCVHTVYSLVW